jgi:hypothetical protein
VPHQSPCYEVARAHVYVCVDGGIAPRILTLALDGGEWSASRPGCSTPNKWTLGTPHLIGDCMGFRACLDTEVAKRKIPSSRRESNPDHRIV